MITLTGEEAGAALGLPPLRSPVFGVSIDSRTIKAGDLFVALRGSRFDGHDYVRAAFSVGACGAVVEKKAWTQSRRAQLRDEEKPVYVVENTLAALAALARLVRRKSAATVIAVTGSVGKTTTKDLLYALASQVRRVVTTRENQNNEIGVPLTLLAIEPDTEVAVVEMGMRGPGQIAELARIAEPDVGIITNIHPVHLELLGSLENIAQAKAELLVNLRSGGIGVIPAECWPLTKAVSRCKCRLVRFSTDFGCAQAEVRGRLVRHEKDLSCDLMVEWPTGRATLEVDITLPGFLDNVLAAAAACYAIGLPLSACLGGVATITGSGRRWRILRLPGIVVIDDSYNANPAAMRAAVEELVRVALGEGGRAVAVLGDMLELGEEEARYHREVGAFAADRGVKLLWGVGGLSRWTVEGYLEAAQGWEGVVPGTAVGDGRPVPEGSGQMEKVNREAKSSNTRVGEECARAGHIGPDEEISALVDSLRPGDVVLVKASRGMRLDQIVDRLVAEAETGRWATGSSIGAAAPGRAAGGVAQHECSGQ